MSAGASGAFGLVGEVRAVSRDEGHTSTREMNRDVHFAREWDTLRPFAPAIACSALGGTVTIVPSAKVIAEPE